MGNRKRASSIQRHSAEPGQDKGKGKACSAEHGNDEQHRLFALPDRSLRPWCDAAAGQDNIRGQSDGNAEGDMSADDKAEFHDACKKEHERDEREQKVGWSVDGQWHETKKTSGEKLLKFFRFKACSLSTFWQIFSSYE